MRRWQTFLLPCIVLAFLLGCNGNQGPMGAPGSPGEGYDALTDAHIQPVVIFAYPSDGSVGPYDVYNQIQIRFNKIMDLSSLRRAITFSSAAGNVSTDTSSITSEGGDLVTVTAALESTGSSFYRLWRIGQSYSMIVSTEAVDVNGNHLAHSFAMTFTPEPYFRVRTVSPRDRLTNVTTRAKLRMSFNSPIDTSILSSVSLSPAVGGVWIPSGSTAIGFRPTTLLDVGTEYILSVGAAAHDQSGNNIPAQYSIRFSTVPFRVSSTSPANGSIGFSRYAQILFTLTGPVDTGTVRNAMSISPLVAGNFVSAQGKSYIRFLLNGPLDPLTEYTLRVSTSLKSASGKTLASPFVLTFTTTE